MEIKNTMKRLSVKEIESAMLGAVKALGCLVKNTTKHPPGKGLKSAMQKAAKTLGYSDWDNIPFEQVKRATEIALSIHGEKVNCLKATFTRRETLGCVAGCRYYTNGEIHHHPDCQHYPISMSQEYDRMCGLQPIKSAIPTGVDYTTFSIGNRVNATNPKNPLEKIEGMELTVEIMKLYLQGGYNIFPMKITPWLLQERLNFSHKKFTNGSGFSGFSNLFETPLGNESVLRIVVPVLDEAQTTVLVCDPERGAKLNIPISYIHELQNLYKLLTQSNLPWLTQKLTN